MTVPADWLEFPGALILSMVVAPSLFTDTQRDSWVGVAICLAIACYLLQEHIFASGGFRNSFTRANCLSNTIRIMNNHSVCLSCLGTRIWCAIGTLLAAYDCFEAWKFQESLFCVIILLRPTNSLPLLYYSHVLLPFSSV